MYTLTPKEEAREAEWYELLPEQTVEGGTQPAVRGRFRTITRPIRRAAQMAAQGARGDAVDGVDIEADFYGLAVTGEAYGSEIIRRTLVELDGVGDADREPVTMSAATIEAFIADDRLYEAAYAKHVLPDLMRQAEKNGLALSPSGTGAGATQEADIVSSPATSTAKRTGGARGARTGGTSRKRSKAKPSGTS